MVTAGLLLLTPATLSARDQETVIPAGTAINVRMIDGVSSSANYSGETFLGSVDTPVQLGGRTVLPRGADAYVRLIDVDSAGRFKGHSELAIQLDRIAVGGYTYPVSSQIVSYRGKGEGKKTAKKSGIGAAVGGGLGALIGGGKGAAIGAGIGAGGGLAASAGKGDPIQIPSESVVQFVLTAPLRIRR
jgi:hypothetical protein